LNPTEILALYDRTMRRDAADADTRRELAEPVLRLISDEHRRGQVVYAALDAASADAIIEREAAYFSGLGYHFEWKHYSHDQPADLAARLLAHGFVPEEAETFLVLDIAQAPASLLAPPAHDVRRLSDPAALAATLPAFAHLWGNNEGWLGEMLISTVREQPEQLSIYVAYVDAQPASVAWIDFSPGKPFSGLWGGSTIEQYRRRGLYTALVAARLQEARSRGVAYLTIDALPTSRPIVERHGFVALSVTTPYILGGG
jgi:GNAT superfamily N-acetyltransferase